MPMTTVTILGPNLPAAGVESYETFHVHATGCQDIRRNPLYRGLLLQHGAVWGMDASTAEEVADAIYSDMLGSGEMTMGDAMADVRFFPCTGL